LNENHNLKMITAGLTITGGAALLSNSDKLASEIFNMNTKIGYPDLTNLSGPTDRLKSPKFATGVGILYHVHQIILGKENKISQLKRKDPIANFFQKIVNILKDYF
ncbi:MAG: hypothetical protein KAW88_10310, partial [Candidatus Cloacimonetes bacterium]|nr:hypothetical protein [Candidatus Cloacimonadota bacterium]